MFPFDEPRLRPTKTFTLPGGRIRGPPPSFGDFLEVLYASATHLQRLDERGVVVDTPAVRARNFRWLALLRSPQQLVGVSS